jgi:hypothetical protein
MRKSVITALGVAALLAAGCGASSTPAATSAPAASTPPATIISAPPTAAPGAAPVATHQARHLLTVHDPGEVTGSLSGPCQTRHHGELPDPSCTPGSVDPAVTQANIGSTICRSGYTETVRPPESQTEQFKFSVAEPAYGQSGVSGELDHLVPLELGGSNDATNLWVESGSIPNPKDAVENALNREVCDGTLSLRAAQREIARNWLTAARQLGQPTGSAPAQAPAAQPPTTGTSPGTSSGCHPTTPTGNCYEPGEFCPTADAGMTGIAGDGKAITCQLVSGRYHWED